VNPEFRSCRVDGSGKRQGRRHDHRLAPDDFVVVDTGFDVTFREMEGPLRDAQLLSIEEGTFQGDQWMPSRHVNGDERHVSLPDKSTILRVECCDSEFGWRAKRDERPGVEVSRDTSP
jgi:hypothetical protein